MQNHSHLRIRDHRFHVLSELHTQRQRAKQCRWSQMGLRQSLRIPQAPHLRRRHRPKHCPREILQRSQRNRLQAGMTDLIKSALPHMPSTASQAEQPPIRTQITFSWRTLSKSKLSLNIILYLLWHNMRLILQMARFHLRRNLTLPHHPLAISPCVTSLS